MTYLDARPPPAAENPNLGMVERGRLNEKCAQISNGSALVYLFAVFDATFEEHLGNNLFQQQNSSLLDHVRQEDEACHTKLLALRFARNVAAHGFDGARDGVRHPERYEAAVAAGLVAPSYREVRGRIQFRGGLSREAGDVLTATANTLLNYN